MPAGVPLPDTGWDKSNHLLAFLALAITGLMAYPKRPAILLASLLAFGGMIEVLQSFTPDRMAEWADLLDDALGLAVGWGGETVWIPACAGMTEGGVSAQRTPPANSGTLKEHGVH